ncbi:MAG: hypothetical protein K6V97_03965 [Actinomycetia bacterium]|nr:hypothetical protein [Actinomycetes bacterium]
MRIKRPRNEDGKTTPMCDYARGGHHFEPFEVRHGEALAAVIVCRRCGAELVPDDAPSA